MPFISIWFSLRLMFNSFLSNEHFCVGDGGLCDFEVAGTGAGGQYSDDLFEDVFAAVVDESVVEIECIAQHLQPFARQHAATVVNRVFDVVIGLA